MTEALKIRKSSLLSFILGLVGIMFVMFLQDFHINSYTFMKRFLPTEQVTVSDEVLTNTSILNTK